MFTSQISAKGCLPISRFSAYPLTCFLPKNSIFRRGTQMPLPRCTSSLSVLPTEDETDQEIPQTVVIVERIKGQTISTQRILKWTSGHIMLTYLLCSLQSPSGVWAHSTRAQASTMTSLHDVLLQDICRVAMWNSLHTFATHYSLVQDSMVDASFILIPSSDFNSAC